MGRLEQDRGLSSLKAIVLFMLEDDPVVPASDNSASILLHEATSVEKFSGSYLYALVLQAMGIGTLLCLCGSSFDCRDLKQPL